MTTAELIWGWTQFALNIVLIISSFKIVHDISAYVKTSNKRFRGLYFKVCKAGERLTIFSRKPEQSKFRRLVAELLELDPEVENPFSATDHVLAFEEFQNVKKRYRTYSWKLWN